MKSLIRQLVGAPVLGLLLCGGLAYGGPITIVDSFDDNVLNPSRWVPMVGGGGTSSISEVNQRLEVSVFGGALDGFGAGVRLLGAVTGNFDVRVRYLITSGLFADEEGNGVGIALSTASQFFAFAVGRDTMDTGCNSYVAQFGLVDPNEFKVCNSDLSGQLRFARLNGVMSAYYLGPMDPDWVQIGPTGYSNSEPITDMFLVAMTAGTRTVSVNFDDFSLEADEITPIPDPGATLLLLGMSLAGLGAARRRWR